MFLCREKFYGGKIHVVGIHAGGIRVRGIRAGGIRAGGIRVRGVSRGEVDAVKAKWRRDYGGDDFRAGFDARITERRATDCRQFQLAEQVLGAPRAKNFFIPLPKRSMFGRERAHVEIRS